MKGSIGMYNKCFSNLHNGYYNRKSRPDGLQDYGPIPIVLNMEDITKQNTNFRTALWTGDYLQLTLMSIPVASEIGLEVHHYTDQFLCVEEGEGLVMMGANDNNLDFQVNVYKDYAFIVPAGTWHNIYNTGNYPLKLYSIYAPPAHPHGTIHETPDDSQHYD